MTAQKYSSSGVRAFEEGASLKGITRAADSSELSHKVQKTASTSHRRMWRLKKRAKQAADQSVKRDATTAKATAATSTVAKRKATMLSASMGLLLVVLLACSMGFMALSYATAFMSSASSSTIIIGQDYYEASARQRQVVDFAYSTGSPGSNLCAAWVTNVYQNAGLLAPGGHAYQMYDNHCNLSNPSEIKVGMIIAVRSTSYSYGGDAGVTYGHVGIYIGDGYVRENTGVVKNTLLSDWVLCAGPNVIVRWGWPCGIDLSK